MTAKEYLEQPLKLEKSIDSRCHVLEGLKNLLTRTTGVLTGVVVTRTRDTHPMETVMVRIAEIEEEISEDMVRLIDLREDVTERILELGEEKWQAVLEMRYLHGKHWDDIADEMCCSRSNVLKMHAAALKEIRVPDEAPDFSARFPAYP